jgi:hypothetical protein
MTRQVLRTVLVMVLGCLLPSAAAAQRLEVSVTPGVITFSPGDPDTVPLILSAPITLTYRIRQAAAQAPWQLTVLASGDLMSGSSTVDISNVSWVATPAPPFRNGTLNETVAQVLATGVGNVNPAQTGSITFRLKNSWTYDTGTYTQTVVFTLSMP